MYSDSAESFEPRNLNPSGYREYKKYKEVRNKNIKNPKFGGPNKRISQPRGGTAAKSNFEASAQQYDNEASALAVPQTNGYRNISVAVFDRSHPDGKIIGEAKENALLKAIFEMMYRELLSDADIKPQFSWSGMVESVYRTVAVGEGSAQFLKDRIENMPPPWPGAKLDVAYESTKRTKVEAYVKGELITTKLFFRVITSFDSSIRCHQWVEMGVRPHDEGHVFTLGIDDVSYRILDQYNGFIPFGDGGIEFRVLLDGN